MLSVCWLSPKRAPTSPTYLTLPFYILITNGGMRGKSDYKGQVKCFTYDLRERSWGELRELTLGR